MEIRSLLFAVQVYSQYNLMYSTDQMNINDPYCNQERIKRFIDTMKKYL